MLLERVTVVSMVDHISHREFAIVYNLLMIMISGEGSLEGDKP